MNSKTAHEAKGCMQEGHLLSGTLLTRTRKVQLICGLFPTHAMQRKPVNYFNGCMIAEEYLALFRISLISSRISGRLKKSGYGSRKLSGQIWRSSMAPNLM